MARQTSSPASFLHVLAAILMLALVPASAASGSETYYIQGNRVLMYKIINWWYDCLPEESGRLCGLPVRCENRGEARVSYRESDSQLTLETGRGLAGQFSLFNSRSGPVRLRCTWLNPAYFGRAQAAPAGGDTGSLSAFVFHRVGEDYHRRIQAVETDIRFQVTGRICGLMNGRIALHPEGDFIKGCPGTHPGDGEGLSLQIFNGADELARYTAVWE